MTSIAALSGPAVASVRASRRPQRTHGSFTAKRRAFRPVSSMQHRHSDSQGAQTAAPLQHPEVHLQPGSIAWRIPGTAAVAALAVLHATAFSGAALAEDAPPPQSPLPSLPSPPEVVRTLSETIFSGPDLPTPEEAPALNDAQQPQDDNTSDTGDAGKAPEPQKPEAKKQNGQQKNGTPESDEQLRQRFESEILPKIQEQLKGLDQNEQPNSATIELKRQLRRVEDDIYRLLDDLKAQKPEAARAEAAGLAREFEDIRSYVKENGGMLADEAKGV